MKEKNVKNIFIALLIGLLISALGVGIWLAFWVKDEISAKEQVTRELENDYKSALMDSLEAVSEMENDLAKLLVATDEKTGALIAVDAYKNAGIASEAVSRMPIDGYAHTDLMKYLNQVGEFCVSYVRVANSGNSVTAYDKQIEALYSCATNIRAQLAEATEKSGEKGYSIVKNIEAGDYISIGSGEMQIEFPTVIYDGPFSDSDNKREWKGLPEVEISEKEALALAREKLGIEGSIVGVSGGDAVMYEIEGVSDGNEAYASITKRGGIIASAFINSAGTGVEKNEAITLAKKYAYELGYCDCMTAVWYLESDGIAVVNLAPLTDGVIYYPDLVKIKIGGGKLLGVEACGYCANHCQRKFPVARMTPDSARKCVSKKLAVDNVRLTVIPKGATEVLCYEIACHYKSLDYFVYVDAHNGATVEIFRVIDDEQGKMVF
ncbi:MAG: germination protein YpeB [Clostridia bacterium]|nr:germination protein YpeB [Clostridia bacterium]